MSKQAIDGSGHDFEAEAHGSPDPAGGPHLVSGRGTAQTNGPPLFRWALGVALLLVAAACSSGSSIHSVAASTTAPPILSWHEIASWHWDSPEQMDSARIEAVKLRESETMLILLPIEGPTGGRIISGDLRIERQTPTGEVNADVAVRIDLADSQLISSIQSSPAEDAVSCDERTDGEWTPRMVRGVEGCQIKQPGGPSFLFWHEAGTFMYAQSELDLDTLDAWLNTWQPISP